MKARADISGDGIQNVAEFIEIERDTQRMVRVTVKEKGEPEILTPGLHGVHIH